MKDVFLFGAGYSARAFARLKHDDGVRIAGTTRDPDNFKRLEALGIEPFVFDGHGLSDELRLRLATATHIVVSAAPDEDGDPVLRTVGSAISRAMLAAEWIGYLSTVGVYGDHGGAWVDESTPCRPVSRRSIFRVAAERQWMDVARETGIPVAVLRLAGIYGPGRNAFVKLKDGTARRLIKPGQVFNRIHVVDIARSIAHLGERKLDGIFNVTDNEPAPPQDVVAFAAKLMGVPVPPDIPFDGADLTPMARSFYGENKRVSNARLKQTGFEFHHPDYRSTLSAIWSDGEWQSH